MDRISKRDIERMTHCELIEALDCAAELGRWKRARRLGREYMRRHLGPPFPQNGRPAQNINDAMVIAQTRASIHDPYWQRRDLWRDLTRVYDEWELDRHILMRCLYWGINIDRLSTPVDGEQCDECNGYKGPFHDWGPKGKQSICQACLDRYNSHR